MNCTHGCPSLYDSIKAAATSLLTPPQLVLLGSDYITVLNCVCYVHIWWFVLYYMHCPAWQILCNPAFMQQYKYNHYYIIIILTVHELPTPSIPPTAMSNGMRKLTLRYQMQTTIPSDTQSGCMDSGPVAHMRTWGQEGGLDVPSQLCYTGWAVFFSLTQIYWNMKQNLTERIIKLKI